MCDLVVTINVLWLFLTVPWVGLQYVVVVFPDHTHLLLDTDQDRKNFSPDLPKLFAKVISSRKKSKLARKKLK